MDDSDRISRLLLELQIDAQTLGKGISPRAADSIRNVVNRVYHLSPRLASKIAKRYKVNYKWLMTGEGEIFEKDKEKKSPDPLPENDSDCMKLYVKGLEDRIAEQSRIIKVYEKIIEEVTHREGEKKFQPSG